MNTKDLLVEIGTEELPPKALKRLSDAFHQDFIDGLGKAELAFELSQGYATPRRLAIYVKSLSVQQADKFVERRGPALLAAFKEDGCPTPAAEGFARSCGCSVDELEKLETDKGSWLVFKKLEPGLPTNELIPLIIQQALNRLPVPKRMRWGSHTHDFVRPVKWLVVMFGDSVVDCSLFGHRSSNTTFGHRFHHPEPITIPQPDSYVNLLAGEGKVFADYATRKNTIRSLIEEAANNIGCVAVIDESLLDEVTGLVEWPAPVVGKFDTDFLDIPQEALISAMKNHQKYFHVNKNGHLQPYFITISNIESSNIQSVRTGNERVIRPRLSDAEFFWKQDKATPLEGYFSRLEDIVFQHQLGSLADKTRRVVRLAEFIASQFGEDSRIPSRAAYLAKCDLVTGMVGEFPELQGTMGRYYALAAKEHDEVALAIDEQYKPRFAGDSLPTSSAGQILSIAEKVDTLIGIFGIGQSPTGDKDPFGLRRAALGVIRILVEHNKNINLYELLEAAEAGYPSKLLLKHTAQEVLIFINERMRGYFAEKGYEVDVFESVISIDIFSPSDISKRIMAVQEFKRNPAAESLAAANKRISNILKKSETIQLSLGKLDTKLFQEKAEGELYKCIQDIQPDTNLALENEEYSRCLEILSGLRTTVDEFFDSVMVNSEDKALRNNRLTLIASINQLFNQVADIGKLQIR
ncbi:MAG: glycine--tRNA ligase subunit beta [Gammaproteobacteria bacterium]|nr:glycine--tRNA ligase subunit beta [Gammaproteobacteria bacterium]